MKVIFSNMTWDFTNVKRISYRQSIMHAGFPIEIDMPRFGFLFKTSFEEIARVESQDRAQRVVNVLTENWVDDTPLFDLDAWLREDIAKHPVAKSRLNNALLELASDILNLHTETENIKSMVKGLEKTDAEIEAPIRSGQRDERESIL